MRRVDRTFRWFTAAILAAAGFGCTQSEEAQTPATINSSAAVAQLAAGNASIENPDSLPGTQVLTAADEKFLDDLESRGIQFYVDSADPVTGLMPDRAKADGSGAGEIASIASVGFGLSALCVGDNRGWVPHQLAYDHSMRVLRFLNDHCPQNH